MSFDGIDITNSRPITIPIDIAKKKPISPIYSIEYFSKEDIEGYTPIIDEDLFQDNISLYEKIKEKG